MQLPLLHTKVPRAKKMSVALLSISLCATLSACTAKMDLDISADGTYSTVLELRDTTGTVFDDEPDCSPYTDPSVVGASEGAEVSVEELTGEEGSGCLVTISSVSIPEADDAAEDALVVRDGELYTVTLPEFAAEEDTDDEAASEDSDYSLSELATAQVTLTFPGAVTQASDGGKVDGRSVTWDDPDVLAGGVQASGYATENQGTHPWMPWATGGLVAAVLALAVGLLRRRRQQP